MIVAAVADTHGQVDTIISSLQKLKPDYLLFAGDLYKDGLTISNRLNIPADIVAGNCDMNHLDKQEEIVSLGNSKILLVHGHQYGVKRDLNRLYYRGLELDVDAVVFGHTHQSCCEKMGKMWLINPGSPVKPRFGYGSYALITINDHNFHTQIVFLN